jgi:hypothetical protein
MNPFDILGSLMGGMRPSAGRLDQTFGNQGYGGPGGMPQTGPGGGMGGGLFDILGKMAGGGLFGGGAPAGGSPFDILSRIGGSLFGSGGSPLRPRNLSTSTTPPRCLRDCGSPPTARRRSRSRTSPR